MGAEHAPAQAPAVMAWLLDIDGTLVTTDDAYHGVFRRMLPDIEVRAGPVFQ